MSSFGYGNQQYSFKESKIGGFDFAAKLITNKKLMNLYGEGCVDNDYPYHYRRMYYFLDVDVYAAFYIGTDDLVEGLMCKRQINPIFP